MQCKCLFVAVVALALVLGGCRKANTVVGTWDITNQAGSTMSFNSDGTFNAQGSLQGLTVTQKGTYTADEKNLNLTFNDVSVTSATDPSKAKLAQGLLGALKGKTVGSGITWKDSDHFSIAPHEGGPTQEFSRKQ